MQENVNEVVESHDTSFSVSENMVRKDVDSEISHSMEARQACQFGDIKTLQRLFDLQLVTPDCTDQDDCSLLHWAAINNRIEIAKFLIERRCNVNAIGGVLASTPLHWAARHGHAKMVSILVNSGADWSIRDVEGFTPLHIAVQFSCTHVAAYLIAAGQSPDELDATRMTPAIWAAYKVYSPDPLHMLAIMGADMEKADTTYRNAPIHWAVVQGNHAAIAALIKLRVDLMPLNKEKETPLDIARRRNDQLSIRLLESALRERRLIGSSFRQKLKDDKEFAQRIIFCLPYFTLLLTASILDSYLNYFAKATLILLLFLSFVYIFRILSLERLDFGMRTLLFGLSSASKIFIIISWLVFIHPIVPWHMQIEFLVALVSVPILFYLICNSDPGYINVSHKERCKMVVSMTEHTSWKGNFCPTCLITRPLRSKHCSVCDKCVMLFDHHCPWLNNCIGGKNNRLFVLYLLALNLSTFLIFIGCFFYWQNTCGQLTLVTILYCKPWVLLLQTLCLFYTVFLGVMNIMHFYQIITATTTNERINMYRYGHFYSEEGTVKNPFTKGCSSNIYSFWCQSSDEIKPLSSN